MECTCNNQSFNAAAEADASMGPQTLEAIIGPTNVGAAWQKVRRNQGCAGVDGVTIAELEPIFHEEWERIVRALRSGDYCPRPLLRVRISKPSGGERLLGIPTVMDRVVQQSVTQILSPRWDSSFSAHSFAYRPARGPRDALVYVEKLLNRGAEYVLHLDIENFFDSVPHPVVLAALEHDLKDERLETLIRRTLNCGVYENGFVRPTSIGLAQGSPLSPLLANVVLHSLDRQLEIEKWDFARYADDCVVLLSNPDLVKKAHEKMVNTLSDLGLCLNERKTSFSHFTEARFLGFAFRRDSRGRAIRTVSPEALAEARDSLSLFVQTAGTDAQFLAIETARMLRSWLAYFYTPQDEKALRDLANHIGTLWRERFSGLPLADCLRWESLRGGRQFSQRMDYAGHFQQQDSFASSVDWIETVRWFFFHILRSRWWHLEYDVEPGRKTGVRLFLGRHRINLHF